MIALCMSDDGMPETVDDRLKIADKLVNGLIQNNVKVENIFIDPLVQPIAVNNDYGMEFVAAVEQTMKRFEGIHTTCGLSNISNGPPDHLRPILNQTYMVMLQKHGMLSVIADPLDDLLIDIAKGNRQDIVDLIYGIMDGVEPDIGSLSKELQDFAKTTNVILGKTLYSDSWLDI